MRARLFAVGLLAAWASVASANSLGPEEGPKEIALLPFAPANLGGGAAPIAVKIPLDALTPSAIPTASVETREQSAGVEQNLQKLAAATVAPEIKTEDAAAETGSAKATRKFNQLTGERAIESEPSDEDIKAARAARILRNPALPASVTSVVARETGLTTDHPLFEHISRRGSQPRRSNNEPIGDAYATVKPAHVIAGIFNLRQESPAYYKSLKNPLTGVMATGMRGGVDTIVEDLLTKGFIQPRSQGRNYSFLNGVYMDLPDYIHEARKWAAVDPYKTEGKERYRMFVAFRAGNVHNPGSMYNGRIVGDGGTLGHVALDKVTPQDVVSIYVERSRMAQTIARLKGTALAHVQVFPVDILPNH